MRLKIYRTSEEELIRKCRNNDAKAQQQVYDLYSSKMYSLCLRYLHDEADAQDVLVVTFVKAFDKISQYKGEGSFEGWLRRITVNEALGYIRKNKSMYLEVDISAAEYHPDYQALSTKLEAEDLLNLIQQLPVGYRTVFNLYAIEGYSHKEIASQLGINENTSKSQLSRARSLLQNKLAQHEQILERQIL